MQVLLQTTQAPTNPTASRYGFLGSGTGLGWNSTESNRAVVFRTAGTLTKLTALVTANDRPSALVTTRKNAGGGATNLSVSVPSSATGVFADVSHSDAVAAGDTWNYVWIPGSGGTIQTMTAVSVLFEATDANYAVVRHLQTGAVLGGNFFPSISGALATTTSYPLYLAFDAIARNLALYVTANTRDGASTLTVRVNAVDSAVSVSVPATTTGTFEDTGNAVDVGAVDGLEYVTSRGGTTGTYTVQYAALDIYSGLPTSIQMASKNQAISASSAFLIPIAGDIDTGYVDHPDAPVLNSGLLRDISLIIGSNAQTSDATLYLRAASDVMAIITIPAGATGSYYDLNTHACGPSDRFSYFITTGGGGNLGFRLIQAQLMVGTGQVVRPISEIQAGNWGVGGGGSNIADVTDESTPGDNDQVTSGTTSTFIVGLGALAPPAAGTVRLKIRARGA